MTKKKRPIQKLYSKLEFQFNISCFGHGQNTWVKKLYDKLIYVYL